MPLNQFEQPIGRALSDWTTRQRPAAVNLSGQYCDLAPLNVARHGEDLYKMLNDDKNIQGWTYLSYGPFTSLKAFLTWLTQAAEQTDPLFFVITDKHHQPLGLFSLLRINEAMGSVEIGHVHYSPTLKRSVIATEAMYLLLRHVFSDLGYRRCEWKCDALNDKSRRAAKRYGFQFEGIFRQAMIYKGRNRDTAWFAMIDKDWPAIQTAYTAWLTPENFDQNGIQRSRLTMPTITPETTDQATTLEYSE